jgi:hypothetical protein
MFVAAAHAVAAAAHALAVHATPVVAALVGSLNSVFNSYPPFG